MGFVIKIIYFFFVVFISVIYSQNSVSIDSLSDEQLLKIYQQYLDSGLSIEQASSLVKENGYSEEQVNKAYELIYSSPSYNNEEKGNKTDFYDEDIKKDSIYLNQYTERKEERISVFGSDFFSK